MNYLEPDPEVLTLLFSRSIQPNAMIWIGMDLEVGPLLRRVPPLHVVNSLTTSSHASWVSAYLNHGLRTCKAPEFQRFQVHIKWIEVAIKQTSHWQGSIDFHSLTATVASRTHKTAASCTHKYRLSLLDGICSRKFLTCICGAVIWSVFSSLHAEMFWYHLN